MIDKDMTIGPAIRMEGVVYRPDERTRKYLEAGVLTRETLVDGFRAAFEQHADRPALVGPGGNFSYAELDDVTDRLAGALLAIGLQPLDRAIFQLGNSNETLFLLLACIKAGIIPVCTLAAHREHEIGYLGQLSEARVHFVQGDDPKFDDVAFANKMREQLPDMRWIVQAHGTPRGGALSLWQLVEGMPRADARQRLQTITHDPFQVAIFQLSGGTTGVPKIIPRVHNEYLYNMRAVGRFHGYSAQDMLFGPLPMMHNLNTVCCYGPMLLAGASCLVSRSLQADELVALLREHQPTWGTMGPVLARIQPALESGELKLTRFRGAIAPNGSPKLSKLLGAPVRHVFGMTEGVVTFTRPEDPQEVQDVMVGAPISEFDEIKLFVPGTEQEISEPGVDGECAFAGPYTIHGYYKAERNKQTFTSHGMYRSGDLMSFRDIDGKRYYQFKGRTKDLISRGGEKINCEEVENLVRRHPDVADVQLCAMPDPVYGERACAFVIPYAGHTAPSVAQLGAFLQQEGLAKFKWPERVEALTEFPVTSSGKRSKALLKDLITAKLAAEAAAKQGAA